MHVSAMIGSTRLASIVNIGDKHMAHSLETTWREKKDDLSNRCKFVDLR
jgi:hypothetical protein